MQFSCTFKGLRRKALIHVFLLATPQTASSIIKNTALLGYMASHSLTKWESLKTHVKLMHCFYKRKRVLYFSDSFQTFSGILNCLYQYCRNDNI
jgi:hypothetical protein